MPQKRFIPTCVGNTYLRIGIYRLSAVHPHVRGEYVTVDVVSVDVIGSSPRAWGILLFLSSDNFPQWFIPTCVGNTTNYNLLQEGHLGSSPRAWGIPLIRCSLK